MSLPTPSEGRPRPSLAVYAISVAAELAGSAPQNLRLYEARGLVTPTRSQGGTRRYSHNDVDRIREIGRLLHAGLNLAGIAMVLRLQDANDALRAQLDRLDSDDDFHGTAITSPVTSRRARCGPRRHR